jgi:hypothetical protein
MRCSSAYVTSQKASTGETKTNKTKMTQNKLSADEQKAYQSTEHGFCITFPNQMTVSVAWSKDHQCDNGQTSAEVAVWDKDNVRYEHGDDGGLWRKGEGIPEDTLHSEWLGITAYVRPSKLVQILDEAEKYDV